MNLFRSSLIGGFNKEDVLTYVKQLEDEVDRLQAEKAGAAETRADNAGNYSKNAEAEEIGQRLSELEKENERLKAGVLKLSDASEPEALKEISKLREENIALREEISKLKNKAERSSANYDSIARVLCDAREKADEVIKTAENKADAVKKPQKRRRQILRLMHAEKQRK